MPPGGLSGAKSRVFDLLYLNLNRLFATARAAREVKPSQRERALEEPPGATRFSPSLGPTAFKATLAGEAAALAPIPDRRDEVDQGISVV
ncbi:hypothetical protein ABIE78_003205 [Sinorhizobium fredii]